MVGAGCGGSTSASGPSTTQPPLPAGSTPSAIAKQPCEREARQQIASALGETASVSDPTWVDHLYACTYQYPTGSMTLSIKELSSWPQTLAYFGSFAAQTGKSARPRGAGPGRLPDDERLRRGAKGLEGAPGRSHTAALAVRGATH